VHCGRFFNFLFLFKPKPPPVSFGSKKPPPPPHHHHHQINTQCHRAAAATIPPPPPPSFHSTHLKRVHGSPVLVAILGHVIGPKPACGRVLVRNNVLNVPGPPQLEGGGRRRWRSQPPLRCCASGGRGGQEVPSRAPTAALVTGCQ
jgi:hypothetical protein